MLQQYIWKIHGKMKYNIILQGDGMLKQFGLDDVDNFNKFKMNYQLIHM